jgi:hypothetical protein
MEKYHLLKNNNVLKLRLFKTMFSNNKTYKLKKFFILVLICKGQKQVCLFFKNI